MKKLLQLFAIALTIALLTSCLTTKKEEEDLSVQDLILAGRIDEAKSMYLSKTDINEKDLNGNTALHAAAKVGDKDLVSFLLIKGADSTLKNDDGDTPLFVSVKNGKYSTSTLLAEIGENIFATDSDGKNAIDLITAYDTDEWYDAFITEKICNIEDSNGNTIIHYFVKTQNQKAINKCIEKNIYLSKENAEGKTPLALAYENVNDLKSVEIAASLIMAKCEPVRGEFSYFEDAVRTHNVSLRSDDNQTPMHIAAGAGHSGIIQYLIKNGASTKAQNNLGSTPLHEAVRRGNVEIIKILLNNGANINARDSLGKTPILIPITKSQNEIYTVLLMNKADANAKDLYGDTPLHIATMSAVDVNILQKLVDAGADINERNKSGVTPLALSVDNNLKEHIKFYANLGADINAEDKFQETPLTKSFLNKDISVLEMLVNSKNISSRDSAGNTPLHLALLKKVDMKYVNYLLSCGADIDARNSDGDSILYLAVKNNMQEIGQILINKGANVYATNTANYSPLRLAMTTGGTTQDWVLGSTVISGDDGNGNTPLHYAAEWKLDDSIAYIIQKGGLVDKKNSNGETPLYNAVKSNSASTVELLLSKGANANTKDYLGNTPLHYCVRWNSIATAKKLIDAGCNIDQKNFSGKTALSDATRSGAKAMVALLLSKGANINSSDATGKTILTQAVQSEYGEMVQLILANGATVNIQDMYGRNSYHEAAETGNITIINLIRDAGGNPLSRDSFGKTPFSLSIAKETSVIDAVLGNDVTLTDSDGNNPLHASITSRASTKILQMLINKGYSIDQRNGKGLTPLGLAIEENRHDLAKILLKNNADPFVLDNVGNCAVTLSFNSENLDILIELVQDAGSRYDLQGDTILHYAARNADLNTVTKLIEMGLDKTKENNAGETPYEVATRWKRPEISKLLL